MPPASISRTWLTVIRIPRIVGSPPQTSGLTVIRSTSIGILYRNQLQRQSGQDFNQALPLPPIPHQDKRCPEVRVRGGNSGRGGRLGLCLCNFPKLPYPSHSSPRQ